MNEEPAALDRKDAPKLIMVSTSAGLDPGVRSRFATRRPG